MAANPGDRAEQFPLIEARYGQPVQYWFDRLGELGDATYGDQMALLRDEHGLSRAHANALVMHHRGSPSARRHDSLDDLLGALDAPHARLIRSILAAITEQYRDLEAVVAWNQPMLRRGSDYVIGVSAAKNHLTIGPWGDSVIEVFAGDLAGYATNKKTFKVPLDWQVDADLLGRIVRYRLDELG